MLFCQQGKKYEEPKNNSSNLTGILGKIEAQSENVFSVSFDKVRVGYHNLNHQQAHVIQPKKIKKEPVVVNTNVLQRVKLKFTDAEDSQIIAHVQTNREKEWDVIAKRLSRSPRVVNARMCRDRWRMYLSPNSNSLWSLEEDMLLRKKVHEIGRKWDEITRFFALKNKQQVINRWKSYLAKPYGDMEHISSSRATTCSVNICENWNESSFFEKDFISGSGLHAEEAAIQFIESCVDAGTLKHFNSNCKNPDYVAIFSISKSPCSSTSNPPTRTDGKRGCAELLGDLKTNGYKGVKFDVILAATKAYTPKIGGGKKASVEAYKNFPGDEYDLIR